MFFFEWLNEYDVYFTCTYSLELFYWLDTNKEKKKTPEWHSKFIFLVIESKKSELYWSFLREISGARIKLAKNDVMLYECQVFSPFSSSLAMLFFLLVAGNWNIL